MVLRDGIKEMAIYNLIRFSDLQTIDPIPIYNLIKFKKLQTADAIPGRPSSQPVGDSMHLTAC